VHSVPARHRAAKSLEANTELAVAAELAALAHATDRTRTATAVEIGFLPVDDVVVTAGRDAHHAHARIARAVQACLAALAHTAGLALAAAAVDVGFSVSKVAIDAMLRLADALDAATEGAVAIDAADGSVFAWAAAAAAIDVGLVAVLSVVVARRGFAQDEGEIRDGAADRE
jgi:hypothetical protein